ncbi:NUDIX hydrolase [Candidatus Falkowbacteria bacterium]|jgi:ADP-ribose pyrophosphatase YjhB (NUDIX family)|nr:NUDIX hydrolase [Candidatus Falkowbacteria bacterium]MBT5503408.1 NUDIX hydrolase [Candidatus Falkowbacteria bacterium]MBT6574029.1 NUDIX hydrolase [Candidatus Falkowbacteria bacterium]MBT7348599.1 NUDIX hydrolase [Candidatus Falkowbacteria bacterium]MBT7500389.1 NUDIX hydrolase [Candidatus Falkowbacteria bacterium]
MAYKGKKSVLAVDLLPVIGWKRVALIKRAKWPCLEKLCIVGGHFDADNEHNENLPEHERNLPDISVPHAALREANEEIHLETVTLEDLVEWCWLDEIGRDPREEQPDEDRRVSKCFLVHLESEEALKDCFADSDALELVICDIDSLTEDDMGFDHWIAIKKLQAEKQRLWEFWTQLSSHCFTHRCDALITEEKLLQDECTADTLDIAWHTSEGRAQLITMGIEMFIVACPFCGHKITPPIFY